MFTKRHYINLISSSIIGVISLTFVYKYSLVYFNKPVLLALLYALLFSFVVISFNKIKLIPKQTNNDSYFFGAILIFFLLLLYYTFFTSKASGSFGLLAIKNWLNNFFNGTFPYMLKDTFSAFPFLYLIASPFYVIGNVALIAILAWAVVALFLISNSITIREKIIKLFFLLVSPLTFYGLFEAPEYFLSAAVLIILIFLSSKYLNPGKIDKYFILFAVLFGLFFSIRIEIVAAVIIYILYFFRNNIRGSSLFLEILLAVFLITIIPFIIWNPVLFFVNGPLNSSFILNFPWWGTIVYLIISVYAGWMISDLQELFFSIGILIIIPSLINLFLINAGLSGLILSLPFLIFSIKDYKIEKFVGKVLMG